MGKDRTSGIKRLREGDGEREKERKRGERVG